MFKQIALALALIAVPAAAVAGPMDMYSKKAQKTDGHKFETAEYEKTELTVKMVFVGSMDELLAAYNNMTGEKMAVMKGDTLHAFSVINPNNNVCKIYAIHPSKKYQPEYIGHELTHCIFGKFHKEGSGR